MGSSAVVQSLLPELRKQRDLVPIANNLEKLSQTLYDKCREMEGGIVESFELWGKVVKAWNNNQVTPSPASAKEMKKLVNVLNTSIVRLLREIEDAPSNDWVMEQCQLMQSHVQSLSRHMRMLLVDNCLQSNCVDAKESCEKQLDNMSPILMRGETPAGKLQEMNLRLQNLKLALEITALDPGFDVKPFYFT